MSEAMLSEHRRLRGSGDFKGREGHGGKRRLLCPRVALAELVSTENGGLGSLSLCSKETDRTGNVTIRNPVSLRTYMG